MKLCIKFGGPVLRGALVFFKVVHPISKSYMPQNDQFSLNFSIQNY